MINDKIFLFKEIESNSIRVQEQKNYQKKLDDLK
jgi:hypothetical protein